MDSFQHSDGLQIYHWPVSEPRAVVLIVHGLGEHAARYAHFSEYLNSNGFAVIAADLPGHGLSAGVRGHILDFEEFRQAVLKSYSTLRECYSDAPVFLLGHSMGGLISTSLLPTEQALFKGAVLSGAALKMTAPPAALVQAILRVLAALTPTLRVLTLDPTAVSRDPAVVAAYQADPLVHSGKYTAGLVAAMIKCMDFANRSAAKIRLPILILHGEDDALTHVDGSRDLYKAVGSDMKELECYPDLFHEILNEPEKDAVYARISRWISSVIAS